MFNAMALGLRTKGYLMWIRANYKYLFEIFRSPQTLESYKDHKIEQIKRKQF